ncbi:UNVERIFIED_CONTAM: hypothetical protein RMT77_015676 [Armadillidium vulgare]
MNTKKLCILVIALLIHFCFTEFGLKVYIDLYYIDTIIYDFYIQENFTTNTLILCSVACLERSDWCTLLCYDKNTKLCLLTNLMVSPYHQDSEGRSVKCHTHLKKDLAFGSIVQSSPVSENFIPNGTEALARGIYNYDWRQTCTGLIHNSDAYILFDLKKLYNIREIRITTQPGAYDPDLPKGTQIIVGKFKPLLPDDFFNFTLFATIPQEVKHHETYTFTSEKEPYVNGQYVAFKVGEGRSGLALCYVQIFE